MRTYYCLTLGALLSVVANLPARAETNLTGKWAGPFNGVQVEIPVQAGPFGYEGGEARAIQGPSLWKRRCRSTLRLSRRALR